MNLACFIPLFKLNIHKLKLTDLIVTLTVLFLCLLHFPAFGKHQLTAWLIRFDIESEQEILRHCSEAKKARLRAEQRSINGQNAPSKTTCLGRSQIPGTFAYRVTQETGSALIR